MVKNTGIDIAHYYSKNCAEEKFRRVYSEYHEYLYLRGIKTHLQDVNGDYWGTISHVLPDGHLIVTDEAGRERRYAFKEVRFIR